MESESSYSDKLYIKLQKTVTKKENTLRLLEKQSKEKIQCKTVRTIIKELLKDEQLIPIGKGNIIGTRVIKELKWTPRDKKMRLKIKEGEFYVNIYCASEWPTIEKHVKIRAAELYKLDTTAPKSPFCVWDLFAEDHSQPHNVNFRINKLTEEYVFKLFPHLLITEKGEKAKKWRKQSVLNEGVQENYKITLKDMLNNFWGLTSCNLNSSAVLIAGCDPDGGVLDQMIILLDCLLKISSKDKADVNRGDETVQATKRTCTVTQIDELESKISDIDSSIRTIMKSLVEYPDVEGLTIDDIAGEHEDPIDLLDQQMYRLCVGNDKASQPHREVEYTVNGKTFVSATPVYAEGSILEEKRREIAQHHNCRTSCSACRMYRGGSSSSESEPESSSSLLENIALDINNNSGTESSNSNLNSDLVDTSIIVDCNANAGSTDFDYVIVTAPNESETVSITAFERLSPFPFANVEEEVVVSSDLEGLSDAE